MTTFSTRHGLSRPEAEITIRQDAPSEVRDALTTIAYRCGFRPSALREVLCGIRYRAPKENWSEFPYIDEEVRGLLAECEWFEVYDFVEAIAFLHPGASVSFADEINRYFRVAGVGWQLVDGRLEIRGAEVFEQAIRQGQQELHRQGKRTAASELHEAIQDLSRRPVAEITGAIQHAMAALECVARDTCVSKDTLGDLIRRNPDLFPKPVDQIVDKAWGYTSNFGRHLQEGKPPEFEEAELMVGISGVLCRYLARRTAGHS
ncbi:AbiJ-NTD4 domain-containing protein [Xanthomonas arboricola]|uniref:AbiJ-NTD4 domain-containing protein n=1 Tax=Xanthomonas arboricola TaxID=56448 RepID=UPI001622C1C8|nr:hypothetical protein [Xanthomonas arboricola]MBB3759559.1 hypothetical protein [Xanthomonas arboricola]